MIRYCCEHCEGLGIEWASGGRIEACSVCKGTRVADPEEARRLAGGRAPGTASGGRVEAEL